jgi:DNA-binding protein HU-beta
MNKTDLVDVIADAASISKAVANTALDAVIESITNALSKGDSVVLVGFGSFVVSKRKQRSGRNPRTGEAITIPAATIPKFRAGTYLKKKVNKGK